MNGICFEPVGYVRTRFTDEEVKNSVTGVEGYIEVLEEYIDALKGLEEFSHIIVVAYMHKVPAEARKTLVVKPRRLLRFGFKPEELPEVGVFATDSPHRPNPIALSILELMRIEGNRLHVRGLDLYDGTPVLDIKPYTLSRVVEPGRLRLPEWYSYLYEKLKQMGFETEI